MLEVVWYTYSPPGDWPGGAAVPEPLRVKHYAGRAHSTLQFDAGDGDRRDARLRGCAELLSNIVVRDRYRREGVDPAVGHKVNVRYVATLQPLRPPERPEHGNWG